MKNKNIIISMFLIIMLTVTSNIFSITSTAGISDNLFQNDLTSLQNKDKELEQRMEQLENSFLDKTYPIGNVYISFENINPSSKFGGHGNK